MVWKQLFWASIEVLQTLGLFYGHIRQGTFQFIKREKSCDQNWWKLPSLTCHKYHKHSGKIKSLSLYNSSWLVNLSSGFTFQLSLNMFWYHSLSKTVGSEQRPECDVSSTGASPSNNFLQHIVQLNTTLYLLYGAVSVQIQIV